MKRKTKKIIKNITMVLLNILVVVGLLLVLVFMVLFEISPAIIILFISTLLGFCLIFINRTLLSELENISKNNN